MKTCKLILAAFLFILSATMNAQFFVGGNAGFVSSADNHENPDNSYVNSSYNFYLSPLAGKFLSDKVALGAGINLGLTGYKNDMLNDARQTEYSIGLNPFIRYYLAAWNKLSLFGQGNINATYTATKYKNNGTTTKGHSNVFALNCFPGLSYAISDRLSFESTIGIFNFSYSYTFEKDGDNKRRISAFNIGAGTNRIITLGSVSIGAIYKF
ncbi:MAG TPA: hypothetical protein VJ963_11090 [Bacteroidales bacterium]|nr:hypothetical protein [Bacteroidales bacterium]